MIRKLLLFLFFSFSCMYSMELSLQPQAQEKPAANNTLQIKVTQECPICINPILSPEASFILDLCTQKIPQAAQHAFHEACLLESYKIKKSCPLCRRAIDSEELWPQHSVKKYWYYTQKMVCGVSYGLTIHSLLYKTPVTPFSLATLVATGFRETALELVEPEEPVRAEGIVAALLVGSISSKMATLVHASSCNQIAIIFSSTFIIIHNIMSVPLPKRKLVIATLLTGIVTGILIGYRLKSLAL